MHCVKSIRIRSYSGPHIWSFILHISPYSVRMRENADQNNSKYVHFLRSDLIMILWNIINFLDRVSSKTRGIQITKLLLPILRKGKKWSEELQVFTSWKRLEVFIKKQKKKNKQKRTLCKKCSYLELFWSTFSRIPTEYGETLRICLYSVRMRENAGQNNSEYGHFSLSEKNLTDG